MKIRKVRLNETSQNIEHEPEHSVFDRVGMTLTFRKRLHPQNIAGVGEDLSDRSFGLNAPLVDESIAKTFRNIRITIVILYRM